jgi:hypothetical protein
MLAENSSQKSRERKKQETCQFLAKDRQKELFLHLLYFGLLLNRKLPSRLYLGVAGLNGEKPYDYDDYKSDETSGELHIRSRNVQFPRISVGLNITSLNPHFAGIYFGTRYGLLSTWRKRSPY